MAVIAGAEIGRRTRQPMAYLACEPADLAGEPIVAAPDELDEVLWLSASEIAERMADLHEPLRGHLGDQPLAVAAAAPRSSRTVVAPPGRDCREWCAER